MIVDVHKQMIKAVASLPLIDGFKPVYEFGDEMHLNLILKRYSQDKRQLYPLIYNITNRTEQESRKNYANTRLQLVIATRNLHTEYKNTERWATSYNNVLFPLVINLDILFNKSQMFITDGEFELFEFPNYGNNKENETQDIWDALRLDTEIKITNNCLGSFKY